MQEVTSHTFSYWEKQYLAHTHWLVVGAGLVGLQSAIALKEQYPNKRILVIDERALGNAASFRNAGFACFGSAGELMDEMRRTSEDEALKLYERRYLGIQKLVQKFGKCAIGFEATGGYEVFTEAEAEKFSDISDRLLGLNQQLQSIHGNANTFQLKDIGSTGMRALPTAVYAEEEGPIQTHLLYKAVRERAASVGVEILEGYTVAAMDDKVGGVSVWLSDALEIQCDFVLVATNGFSKRLMPELEVSPARGQVFITESLPFQPLNGIYHADDGYIYFRSLGDRILIGGGRNQAFSAEETMQMHNTELIRHYIQQYVSEVILPHRPKENPVKFEYEWAGIMGMHENRNPIIQFHSSRIMLAIRMGGMGVALSSWVAEEVMSQVKEMGI